ncbi:hypothetical protein BH09SUM1_BH09SUM1_34510 [soil metagenome]
MRESQNEESKRQIGDKTPENFWGLEMGRGETIASLYVAGCVFLLVFGWLALYPEFDYLVEGVDGVGTVTGYSISSSVRGGRRYYVDHSYTLEGVEWQGRSIISKSASGALSVGAKVPIQMINTGIPQTRLKGSHASVFYAFILSLFGWCVWTGRRVYLSRKRDAEPPELFDLGPLGR